MASRQHDRITVPQLVELGMSHDAIRHRVRSGKLHRVGHGVLSVSRPRGTASERWMDAALSCGGSGVAVSFSAGLALWGLGEQVGPTDISVFCGRRHSRPGIRCHRRSAALLREVQTRDFIPVTSPALTIIDNARRLGHDRLEQSISEADARKLVTVKVIRRTAERFPHVPGAGAVSKLIDRRTFVMKQTQLERWFARIVRRAGLPMPLTQQWVNGCKVDFYWPALGLVVEADGGRFHRTPGQQTTDRRRDQKHFVAGLTPLRFTHEQVRYKPDEVLAVLVPVIERLKAE